MAGWRTDRWPRRNRWRTRAARSSGRFSSRPDATTPSCAGRTSGSVSATTDEAKAVLSKIAALKNDPNAATAAARASLSLVRYEAECARRQAARLQLISRSEAVASRRGGSPTGATSPAPSAGRPRIARSVPEPRRPRQPRHRSQVDAAKAGPGGRARQRLLLQDRLHAQRSAVPRAVRRADTDGRRRSGWKTWS